MSCVHATQGAYGPLTSLRTLLASTVRAWHVPPRNCNLLLRRHRRKGCDRRTINSPLHTLQTQTHRHTYFIDLHWHTLQTRIYKLILQGEGYFNWHNTFLYKDREPWLTSALQLGQVVVLTRLAVTLVAAQGVQAEAPLTHLRAEQRTLVCV